MEIWEIDATMIASLSTHIQQINIYDYRKIYIYIYCLFILYTLNYSSHDIIAFSDIN